MQQHVIFSALPIPSINGKIGKTSFMAIANIKTLSEKYNRSFRVTGRMVMLSVVGFFIIVIGVNVGMAFIAVETFSGLQTEKPYENGLAFNREIKKSQEQAALGWRVEELIIRGADNVVDMEIAVRDEQAQAVKGLMISAIMKSPADYRKDCRSELIDDAQGKYRAQFPCSAGQWDVEIVARRGGDVIYRSINRIILH